MKPPKVDVKEVLAKPSNRALLNLLLKRDEPIRFPNARELSGLSMAQFGLAVRSLENLGFAQRRNLMPDGETMTGRLPLMYLEATDMGREQGPRLVSLLTPAVLPTNGTPPTETQA